MSEETTDVRFSVEADQALKEFYGPFHNGSAAQKIGLLKHVLGDIQVYATGGDVTDDITLTCFEYEWLSAKGLVEFDLA